MQSCGFGRIRPYLAILTPVAACAMLAAAQVPQGSVIHLHRRNPKEMRSLKGLT